jgi:hypothetical protein
MTRPLALVLGLFAAAPSAFAQEYREFTLSDGRVLYSELLATEVAGLRIRLPQGETEIPFTLLVDMVPATTEQYTAQTDWKIVLDAPAEVRPKLLAAFKAIPNLYILGEPGAPTPLTGAQKTQLEACAGELDCMVYSTASAPWMWLVSAKVEGEGPAAKVTLTSRLNTGPTGHEASFALNDHAALQTATYTLLDVTAKAGTPPLVGEHFTGGAKPTKPGKPSGGTASAASPLVPIPGWTALKNDDMAGFGMAMGIVLPATAAYFASAGHSAQSAPEGILLGVGGFYAATVLSNHLVAQRGGSAGDVVVHPVAGPSGTGVGVTVRK